MHSSRDEVETGALQSAASTVKHQLPVPVGVPRMVPVGLVRAEHAFVGEVVVLVDQQVKRVRRPPQRRHQRVQAQGRLGFELDRLGEEVAGVAQKRAN